MKIKSANILIELFRILYNFFLTLFSLFLSLIIFKSLPSSNSILLLAFYTWLAIVIFFLVFSLQEIVILKFLFLFIKPGVYSFTDKKIWAWLLAENLQRIQNCAPIRILLENSMFFRYLYLKLLGAKVDFSINYGTKIYLDGPPFIRIGKNSIIGSFVIIFSHMADHKGIYINYVTIGDNVTVGAGSYIFPGVKIGDNSVVGSCSLVLKDTFIGENEVWAGIPAKKIKDLPHNL